ncbi:MAG: FAD-dependent oxidoreductase [archaeon]
MEMLIKEARVYDKIIKNKHYRLLLDTPMDFKPGQYIELYLKDKFGHLIPPRPYTISSASTKDFLELYIGVINQGLYSTKISKLKKGDMFYYKGPLGETLLDRIHSKNLLIVAFGSGISTYRSLIHLIASDKSYNLKLIYINSHYDDFFYNDEFYELEKQNSNFAYYSLVTKEDSSKKPKELFFEVFSKIENKDDWNYLISGPQKAVTEFYDILIEHKIKGEKIITD